MRKQTLHITTRWIPWSLLLSRSIPKLWSPFNFQSTDVEGKHLKMPGLLNVPRGWWTRFTDGNGCQRIIATRWKIKSENKFSSPCKAELDSSLEKDQVTSKWLWFPNHPGICHSSPRILEMLSSAVLLISGQHQKVRNLHTQRPGVRRSTIHTYQTKMRI